MNKVSVSDILQGRIEINNNVVVCGWVRNRRDSNSGISFITVNDGSCLNNLQIIVSRSLNNYKKEVLHISTGFSIIVYGLVVKSLGKQQSFELKASKVEIIGDTKDPGFYPVAAKKHTSEYLRTIAHLRPRTSTIGAVTRIRHIIAQSLHHFLSEQGYLWVTTPLITALDTEGRSNMFRVSTLDMDSLPRTSQGKIDFSEDFFGKESFLTVSGQLNAEAYACALSKVYTFGPVFRAENSNTSRHLAEFWMLEPETAFSDLEDTINLAKSMLKYVISIVITKCDDDINFLTKQFNKNIIACLQNYISHDPIQLSYSDAILIIKKHNKEFKKSVSWGENLSIEHERYLTDRYFKSPVIIKNHPKESKAFYMRLNDDNRTVASVDILMPNVGEIIGGSQREERLDILDQRLVEMGLNKKDYWWYRDLRKYGTVPHSGFGLGFERLVSYITSISNVRDVIPFPRVPNNIRF